MNEKFIKEAETIVNISEINEQIEDFIRYIPSIAKLAMSIYIGFIREGFSEQQAFEFAKEISLKILLQNQK